MATDVDVAAHDVIVVGAGVSGIYQTYRMVEAGLDVTVLEAGEDLGGTWYWNRYPGARFDSESITYAYTFSDDLLQDWDWQERFAAQPETLQYLNFVVEKFDLRKYMQFGVTVRSAVFDDDAATWTVLLADGRELRSRFLVLAVGLLSSPTEPAYDGVDSFRGRSFHTMHWPSDGVELEGKRVGVIGTGATGVQVISSIASQVEELHVFQRRPNWCAPLNNSEIPAEEMEAVKARYREILDACRQTPGGFVHQPDRRNFFEVPRHERLELWERLYRQPGFGIWLSNFRDIFFDEDANREISAFIADKIRARVHDPDVAERLIPKDHGFGTRRIPLETNYYEAYNRDNVVLVDLVDTPIVRITEDGIKTTEQVYELDLIVYATGFDAILGAFNRMDIRGAGGVELKDKWRDGPSTLFGMQVSGFPNLFMPTGPQSASATTNFPRAIEAGVDWCSDLITHMVEHGYTYAEARTDAEEWWGQHVREMFDGMLMSKTQSWFTGYNSNVDGRGDQSPKQYLVYNGGLPRYRRLLDEEVDRGYPGVELRRSSDDAEG